MMENTVVADEVAKTEEGFVVEGPDQAGQMILVLNQIKSKGQIYAGTVPPKVIQKRRTKNKLQKASRKANR